MDRVYSSRPDFEGVWSGKFWPSEGYVGCMTYYQATAVTGNTSPQPWTAKDHIYSLATDFTTFYTECFVIGSEQEKSRLVLLEARAIGLPSCDHDDQTHLHFCEVGCKSGWKFRVMVLVDSVPGYELIYIVNLRICSVFCLCSPVLVDRHIDHVYDIELAHFDFERLFWGYDVYSRWNY